MLTCAEGRDTTAVVRRLLLSAATTVCVHFTPLSGSWLTLAKRGLAALTTRQLRRRTPRSGAQTEPAIQEFSEAHHADRYRSS